VVYISAALGVVLDVEHNRQRFYHGHTDDVICLATHPVRLTAADHVDRPKYMDIG
jgi:hypothetical protein